MQTRKRTIRMFAWGLVLLLLAGCSALDKGSVKQTESQKRLPDVREFEDVLIPREMDIDKEGSAIYRREGMAAGLLRMSGRVEMTSLMRYFQNNMANEGWRPVSQFRSPHTLMLFQKGNRMAVVALEDADFQTFADVWVVPLNESIDSTPAK
jgi:hypothetical protein